jgi:hypothetical protein
MRFEHPERGMSRQFLIPAGASKEQGDQEEENVIESGSGHDAWPYVR